MFSSSSDYLRIKECRVPGFASCRPFLLDLFSVSRVRTYRGPKYPCPLVGVGWLVSGSGPIAPRREPFSPPPHSSPLQSPHRHHLLSSLWQDSLPGPLPHLPTRLSSSRKGPDGSFLHRASSQPHELVDPSPRGWQAHVQMPRGSSC